MYDITCTLDRLRELAHKRVDEWVERLDGYGMQAGDKVEFILKVDLK